MKIDSQQLRVLLTHFFTSKGSRSCMSSTPSSEIWLELENVIL